MARNNGFFHTLILIILSLIYNANATTLLHWSFDGPLGEKVDFCTDEVLAVALEKFKRPGIAPDVSYSKSNPWHNTQGTSIEFLNNPALMTFGSALALLESDAEKFPDLSLLDTLTIEFFMYPYLVRDCTLVGKKGSTIPYQINIQNDGSVCFVVNEDNIIATESDIVTKDKWFHIAVVLDRNSQENPLKIYVNGSLAGADNVPRWEEDSTYDFLVGVMIHYGGNNKGRYNKHEFFTGRIDELRISDQALIPNDFLFNTVPTKATYPYPEDRADQFSCTTHLSWQPVPQATSQRIYFGHSPNNLKLLQEVDPGISRIENSLLGGKLALGTTYYWRVDSQLNEDMGDSYEGADKGDVWRFTTRDNRVRGRLKWLLHLGQTPNDRFVISNPLEVEGTISIESLTGKVYKPEPGQIFDISDFYSHDTTHQMMIWTPQYCGSGVFINESIDGSQFYHIYIQSPEPRTAQLCLYYSDKMSLWINGEQFPKQELNSEQEYCHPLELRKGANAITLTSIGSFFTAHITDPNGNEFNDLTYSLKPVPSDDSLFVDRTLPSHYQVDSSINVTLNINIPKQDGLGMFSIIEYIPKGLGVIDSGGGEIIGNTIWWNLNPGDFTSTSVSYSLSASFDHHGAMPFLGYLYQNKQFHEITGDKALFQEMQVSPADVADQIETVEIDPAAFSAAEHASLGSISIGRVKHSGLKPDRAGAWAEYEFTTQNPGAYHIVFEYGEFWTMFHHCADIEIWIDDQVINQESLFPTTHYYTKGHEGYNYPWLDPHRKARWVVGQVALNPGMHTMKIHFISLYPGENIGDDLNDGHPVISSINLINYPGFVVPGMAEPHHLDSYEHAPARLVHSRDISELVDGRIEMAIHGTFYSLSQGNEIYFADGHVRPKPGIDIARFEIVSFEPEVFHLAPEGEQDFILTVRSTEPVDASYSEMVIVWLQGTPSSPARKPYYFTTARDYIDLPPFNHKELPWRYGPFLDVVRYSSRHFKRDIEDTPETLIPDLGDLGLVNGRYNRDIQQFISDQFLLGKLPSVESQFADLGWDYENHSWFSWGQIWSQILATGYWKDNVDNNVEFVKRLAENMVFYPVITRWDWARPEYFPPLYNVPMVKGLPALAVHIRNAQEGLVSDTDQFRIIHNLVLPIYNSYWDEMRATAVLTEDATAGDFDLRIDRPFYGDTGIPKDGFGSAAIKIARDPYRVSGYSTDTIRLIEPLIKSYPRGTLVTSWAFSDEEIELESKDIISLIVIGAASRDSAIIDECIHSISEILEKQKIYLEDGSFRNEPGSYGGWSSGYIENLIIANRLFGLDMLANASDTLRNKLYNAIIYALEFAFSNGNVPHLNRGGTVNQLNRAYHIDVRMLEEMFPEDIENITLYKHIVDQEANRVPGDIIDNHNFMIPGWGYAMLRSEGGSWDRGMETLLSSKHLLSDPGDHVSHDCLGLVVYGLGAIMTPRYGSSWVGYRPPFLNQVMIDDHRDGNGYYGSFWHYDGRKELPCAVAHTGDGKNCSELDFNMSRWCIQFPEYLFDAYFVEAKDSNEHQYDWSLINMGELEIIEPKALQWEPFSEFLADYWPAPGTRGAGERSAALKAAGQIVADWHVSNASWIPFGDSKLLRYPPAYNGKLRLIAVDDSSSLLINSQIDCYDQPALFQANSQDILTIRKQAHAHAFIDTLETIAEDEEPFVKDVTIVSLGPYMQRLMKVTTSVGQDWVYLSGKWKDRSNGEQPIADITTDADMVIWRTTNGLVTRVYIANGSYAITSDGQWQFESFGNHYLDDTN